MATSAQSLSSDTFKPLLSRLVDDPSAFTPSDLTNSLSHILHDGPPSSAISPTQIGAFLTALHMHRIDKQPEMLLAAADYLRSKSIKAIVEHGEDDFIVDIVGTGGDGWNTFNVSTTAAIVAAGAGARVCKHGSRASTSSSGSADLLQSLGCVFTPPPSTTNTTANGSPTIPRIPFTFLLAPLYHPTLSILSPHRKSLPFRTMFNILGPLINPANPNGIVIGVADKELGGVFARCLRDGGRGAGSGRGARRALVVCGEEGLDEISCAGGTYVWEVREGGEIVGGRLDPVRDFGVGGLHALSEVSGGTPEENAKTFLSVLGGGGAGTGTGTGTGSDNKDGKDENEAVKDFVLLNASALLVVAGLASDYKHGVKLARESIDSGNALKAFEQFREECSKRAGQEKA